MKMTNNLNFYDIHGFVVVIEGSADKIFSKEYGYFRTSTPSKKVDLFIKVYKGKNDLPTKPAGSSKGMYIPFNDDENILWYEEGVALNVLLSYCEALIWWSNKTILHAGGVAKEGKAVIFTGGGNVGKTSTVLNLLKEGYEYLGDDWIVVGEGKAYPLPKLIHIFDYNLENREIAQSVLGLKRFLYKPFFKLIEIGRKHFPHRYIRYGLEVIKPMFPTNIKKIHPKARVASPTRISKVFYLERQNVEDIKVMNDVEAEELARRMAYVNLFEWNFFFKEYYRYVYLYNVRSEKVENRFKHDFKVMQDVFKRAELYKIIIPRGLDLTTIKLIKLLPLD